MIHARSYRAKSTWMREGVISSLGLSSRAWNEGIANIGWQDRTESLIGALHCVKRFQEQALKSSPRRRECAKARFQPQFAVRT